MANYEWSCETSVGSAHGLTAEDWMREVWEQGPRFLQVFLSLAWRYGLGLRLGAASDVNNVLGWPIAEVAQNQVTVKADSRLMTAQNSVTVDEQLLRWKTTMSHKNPVGRILWVPAQIVHQWLVPRSLRRAVRNQQVK